MRKLVEIPEHVTTNIAFQDWKIPLRDLSCWCNIPFVHVERLLPVLWTRLFSDDIPDSGSYLSLFHRPTVSAMLRRFHEINKLIRNQIYYNMSIVLFGVNRTEPTWMRKTRKWVISVFTIPPSHVSYENQPAFSWYLLLPGRQSCSIFSCSEHSHLNWRFHNSSIMNSQPNWYSSPFFFF